MSTLYLLDFFGDPIPVILDPTNPVPTIRDIIYGIAPGGRPFEMWDIVVKVSDQIAVIEPSGYSDLILKKYQGILAFYAGLTRITYDDLFNTLGLNLAAPGTKGSFGDRNRIALFPTGVLTTVSTPLTGPAASQAIVTWDIYEEVLSDTEADRTRAFYGELPTTSGNATVQVSFNNGATFLPALDGAVMTIPVPSQGTNFIFKITNTHPTKRIRVGSWAVVY